MNIRNFYPSITLLFIIVLSCIQLSAQSGIPLRLGITAAPVVSWLRLDNGLEGKAGIGFQAGITVDYVLEQTRKWEFSSGLMFSQFDETFEMSNTDNLLLEVSYHTRYLELPLMVKTTITEFNYFRFFVQTGLVSGLRLSNETDWTILDPSGQSIEAGPEGPGPGAVSVIIGGGTEYSIGQHAALTAGLNYTHGLNKLNKMMPSPFKRNSIMLRAGFLF